mmetsp:Transcript_63126/g.185170  ORF Transcript_63126/g.185170 Transcript_63126/m.185170 type:complete len:205 (+) Transcript_63126:351-965(+)
MKVSVLAHAVSRSNLFNRIMSSPRTSSLVRILNLIMQVPFRMTRQADLSWMNSWGLNISARKLLATSTRISSGTSLRYQILLQTRSTPDSIAISPWRPWESHSIVCCWCRCRCTWKASCMYLLRRHFSDGFNPRAHMSRLSSSMLSRKRLVKVSMLVTMFTVLASTNAHVKPVAIIMAVARVTSSLFAGRMSPKPTLVSVMVQK